MASKDRIVYSNRWFTINERRVLQQDEPYYVLNSLDYVSILAITIDNKVLLVRQRRPAVQQYTLELPSGHVEPGESPDEAARRELLEETGHRADDLEPLGCLFPDTGRLGNRLWCYFTSRVAANPNTLPVSEEGVELVYCSFADLAKLVVDGGFNHALSLAVVLLAAANGDLSPIIGRLGAKRTAG